MLELLPEDKRKILLSYPFVRDYFGKRHLFKFLRKRARRKFLRNLESFESDLKAQNILDSELEIVKREITSEEFEEICNKFINSLSQYNKKIVVGLKNKESHEREKALSFLYHSRLNVPVPLMEQMLKDPSERVKTYAINILAQINSKSSTPVIEQMLRDSSNTVRVTAAESLYHLSGNMKYHILYRDITASQDSRFHVLGNQGTLGVVKRREFDKTGARTVLLGGNLVGKVIVRIVSEGAFLAWKKAFEADESWTKAGFDYTPVEPILMKNGKLRAYKFKSQKYTFYRVFTRVIAGPSLAEALMHKENFNLNQSQANALEKTQLKIILVLGNIGIIHGHLHSDNFVVEIDSDGPRLCVIDFGEARLR